MKKYIASFILFYFFCFYSFAQTTQCNDALLLSIKGTWSKISQQPMLKPVTKAEFDQATKNMGDFHQLLLMAYPEGIGCEPQVNMINPVPSFYVPSVYSYYYLTAIFPYVCIKNKPTKITDTNTTLRILVNSFENFWTSTQFFIAGQEIFYRQPNAGKWNGYNAYYSDDHPLVMLTRKDMLPYKRVTRKEYLDYMIHHVDSSYTNRANLHKKHDDLSMKELATTITNQKNNILTVFREETEKSSKLNLLDSPAVVNGIRYANFSEDTRIFITEEEGGKVLLMINPDYFRKDLPKYVPQFMIVRIQGGEDGKISERYFAKNIKEKFPFEKLQAMIDK
jgi:hypothetical protein